MNRNFFLHYVLGYLFCCQVTTVFAQFEKAESRIDTVMKRFDMVGLSVAVVKEGEIIYNHSFGFKNVESRTALSNNDIFRIASISKSFSATSIMQLAERNKLSLSDDVSNL